MGASLLLFSCGNLKQTAVSPITPVQNNFPNVDQKGKTAIVAHRGFWNCAAAGFAQNSIAALREAQNNGFWGSECDLHLTSDGVVLVHHDQSIAGIDIQTNTAETFSTHRLKNGECVPTLGEYLSQAEQSEKTVLVLELKPQYSIEHEDMLISKTLAAVKEHGLFHPSRVAFISFSKHICDVLARECPAFINQYLNGDLSPESLAACGINGFDYEEGVVLGHTSIIERAHKLGMSTNVWTVNGSAQMQKLIDLGINAITTNEPLLLRDLLDRKEFKN